jgi:AraC-like DNA-binding protein
MSGMPWSRVVNFSDPVSLQGALQSATQAEILPTVRGQFQAQATQIGMDRLRMQRFQIHLPQIVTVATAPERRSIGFLIEGSSSDLHHCGLKVATGNMLMYGNDVLHQRSGSDFRYGTMSLPADEFPVVCRAIIGHEFLEEPLRIVIRPDPALMSRLLKVHKVVGQLAHDTPDLLDLPQVRRALEQQLIHIMVRCLAEGAGVQTSMGAIRHEAIMVRFEEYLEANSDRPLYLPEICAAIGVSERTLRAVCEEHLGMGPIRFLALRRMHLVQRALSRADQSSTTVTRIVTDHGFWELGRFSVAYRTLFGEMPSVTLRRRPEPITADLNRAILTSVIQARS